MNRAATTGGALSVLRRAFRLSPALHAGIVTTSVLGLVAAAGRVALPVAVQTALDTVTATDTSGAADVAGPVLLAAGAVLATATCAYLVSVRLYRSSEAGLADVRTLVFRHIHALPLVRQERKPRGALVASVTSDVDVVSGFLQYKGLMLALSGLQLIATTAVMAWYDLRLTLVVWAFQLPLIVLLSRAQRALAARFGRLQESVAGLLGVASEMLAGAEAVHAHAAQRYVTGRADAAIDAVSSAQLHAQWGTVRAQIVAEIVPGLITAALVLYGARLVAGATLTVGDLAAFLFLSVLLVTPTRLSVTALTEAQRALSGWRRLLGVLDEPADDGPSDGDASCLGTAVLGPGPAEIRFDRVTFAYPSGRPVLDDLSVTLPAGARVAVVGETGAGKTTFAKLACGLLEPAAGQVSIGGVPLRELSRDSLRRRIVVVPQEGYLFDTTIAENVRLGAPSPTDDTIRQAFADLGLAAWLAALPLGLGTPTGPRGGLLSAGERQLVALARAHAAEPSVLILDEATSAVDPATEERIQRALDRLTAGRTAIVVAHRLATAQTAGTVLVFAGGRIVESGPPEALLRRGGAYAALHDAWVARPQ
ncbi:ABC transporter ATP-binding protein/permease [Dactylosporangium sp. NBC_01737]|uniref:ABC transporter ATP-binding protein n=1 Tax=Dactylosporangium sp. NBC_01737 TaxID=2975959 RepID=UPI002E166DE4|nr:ABC transporter ATP-binding protein/permease [Dactylosporangium sp. NBC_01737]